jgi:hypothetical protein
MMHLCIKCSDCHTNKTRPTGQPIKAQGSCPAAVSEDKIALERLIVKRLGDWKKLLGQSYKTAPEASPFFMIL